MKRFLDDAVEWFYFLVALGLYLVTEEEPFTAAQDRNDYPGSQNMWDDFI